MAQFLLLTKNFAPILYAIGLGLALWGFKNFVSARGELAMAQFRLEREQAEQNGGQGLSLSILSMQFMALIFILSTITYDAFQEVTTFDQPEAPVITNQFGTTVPADNDGQLIIPTQPPDGVVLLRTQPPSPTFAGTVLPHDDQVGCTADKANIEIPNNGQLIYETQPIIGVASVSNFAYYRFEIRNVSAGEQFFGVIGGAASDYTVPVPESGPLGSIIPQNFVPGEYRFRLMVFDTSGQIQEFCEISLFISDPIPTATPLGAGVPIPPAPSPDG